MCMRGCLTLKFSGSWNTVIFSPLLELGPLAFSLLASEDASELSAGAGATSAMMGSRSAVLGRPSDVPPRLGALVCSATIHRKFWFQAAKHNRP